MAVCRNDAIEVSPCTWRRAVVAANREGLLRLYRSPSVLLFCLFLHTIRAENVFETADTGISKPHGDPARIRRRLHGLIPGREYYPGY